MFRYKTDVDKTETPAETAAVKVDSVKVGGTHAPVVKHEKTPAEKGAATKKRHARAKAKADAAGPSVEAVALQVIALLRGPVGGSTELVEDRLDELEVALGRDPSDDGREFPEVVFLEEGEAQTL